MFPPTGQFTLACLQQGRQSMGDKGGQKDKNKGQKQKAAKDAEKKKQQRDKQAKAKHV